MVNNAHVLVRSTSGVVLDSKDISIDENGEAHFDIAWLSPGVYFVEMNAAGVIVDEKIEG